MKTRLCIEMKVLEPVSKGNGSPTASPEEQTVQFSFTRNDSGGLQDAIELLINHLLARGVKAELVEGRLNRPKSDSFEDFSPFFESAVLQKSSQEFLNRPGSRLSGDFDMNGGSESTRPVSATEQAFYSGDKRRTSVPDMKSGPGSTGSGASSRASYHSRGGSLDSDWEHVSPSLKP
jgi:hypothetical protein